MLETLFLFSLGITFLLILLLIYHFKNRLAGLEQKHEVLLEILNTLVQETHMLKAVVGSIWRPTSSTSSSSSQAVAASEFSKELEEEEEDASEDDQDSDSVENDQDSSVENDQDSSVEELEELEELEIEEDATDVPTPPVQDLDNEETTANNAESTANNEESIANNAILDKLKLPELRALVTQRGLSTEASKLKKQQLLDLLSR